MSKLNEMKHIRKLLMNAHEHSDKELLLFGINRLDTLIHLESEALKETPESNIQNIHNMLTKGIKCNTLFSMKYVEGETFTESKPLTQNLIDNVLGDRSVETIRIDIPHSKKNK